MVRDEADGILEWILFHHLVGFDAVVVIDHGSTDDTVRRAASAAPLADIRVFATGRTGPRTQEAVYLAACAELKAEFDWVGFLDADEFLVGRDGASVRALIGAQSPDVAAVAVPWRIFGSSGHAEAPAGLVIESFTRRAPLEFEPNRHVKDLVRPGAVRACVNAHRFVVDGDTVLPDGGPVVWASPGKLAVVPPASPWNVHHYFTRSRTHWARRLARGQLGPFTRTWGDFDAYDRNEVVDGSAARFGDRIRALMAGLGT